MRKGILYQLRILLFAAKTRVDWQKLVNVLQITVRARPGLHRAFHQVLGVKFLLLFFLASIQLLNPLLHALQVERHHALSTTPNLVMHLDLP